MSTTPVRVVDAEADGAVLQVLLFPPSLPSLLLFVELPSLGKLPAPDSSSR